MLIVNRARVEMQTFLRKLAIAAGLLTLTTPTLAQKVEFSANMQVSSGTAQSQTLKLFVGNQRARFDRPKEEGELNGIGSIILDFEHQFIYLLIPQSKLYLQVEGSLGTPFYSAAWMFRPYDPASPCRDWITEADRRGLNLRCQRAGDENLNGKLTHKWNATTTAGGSGALWYAPDLNFIVKVLRTSKDGVQSGYELQNVNQGTQDPALFDIPAGYRKFTLPKLLDVLTGVGQW
jgi:hypothetical protein